MSFCVNGFKKVKWYCPDALLNKWKFYCPDSFGNGQTQPKRRYTRPGGRGLRPTRYRPREEATDYCDEVFDCLKKGVCKANPAKPCHCQFNECKTKLDKVQEIIKTEIPNTKDSCKGVGDCYKKKICHPSQACNCLYDATATRINARTGGMKTIVKLIM